MFDFKIRRDHENISYERRVYESEDDKSLSWDITKNRLKTIFMQQSVNIEYKRSLAIFLYRRNK